MMTAPGRSFEHYACRVNCLLLALLLGGLVVRGKGLILIFLALSLLRTAYQGFDLVRASQWWWSIVIFGALSVAFLMTLPWTRQDPLWTRAPHFVATGAALAQISLLVGGRWRRVWGFVRPPPAPQRPLSLAGRPNVGNTFTDA